MTLDKRIVLQIRTLTGYPLCRESHPLCRLKNPTVIQIWLLVGLHPATQSVQGTLAYNTRKRVWQYIEKERKAVCCVITRDCQMRRLIDKQPFLSSLLIKSRELSGRVLDLRPKGRGFEPHWRH